MRTILWSLATIIASPFLLFLLKLRGRGIGREKVLIIRLGKLGDVLATTRMLRAIREAKPDVVLHVLTTPQGQLVLRNNPFIDRVIPWDVARFWTLLSVLRSERYDWVINAMPGALPSSVGLWALVPGRINTVSPRHGVLVSFLNLFSTHSFVYDIHERTHEHFRALLRPLAIPPLPEGIDFFPNKDDELSVTKWLQDQGIHGERFVIFNVTAGNIVKEWPPEKFRSLAKRIVRELHCRIVISTANRSLASSLVAEIGREIGPNNVTDGSGLTLFQLAVLCRRASAFLSADTGPLYVAWSTGVPLAIIIGPIDPNEQVPHPNAKIVHISPPPDCVPWVFVAVTPREGTTEQMQCVQGIPVDAVFTALSNILRKS